eukprot:30995-Pelagococcus_subviridis.AAC.4
MKALHRAGRGWAPRDDAPGPWRRVYAAPIPFSTGAAAFVGRRGARVAFFLLEGRMKQQRFSPSPGEVGRTRARWCADNVHEHEHETTAR